MAKFKVGDEVKLGGGCARVIHIESTGGFPYLVERADNRIEFCNDAEMMLITPAIPAGWTPASEPPDNGRDVRALTANGEPKAWFNCANKWRIYFNDTQGRHAAPGEVIAWREIEPAAKPAAQVRYVVCAIPTEYGTLEEAELHAQRAVESLRVNVVIARVVAEVKPGKPEIIRMEE